MLLKSDCVSLMLSGFKPGELFARIDQKNRDYKGSKNNYIHLLKEMEHTGECLVDMDCLSQVLLDLIYHCCQVLQQFQQPQCHLHKDPQNPLTEVDLLLQTLLETGVRQHWPSLPIMGEEDLTYSAFPYLQALVAEKLEKVGLENHKSTLLPQMKIGQQLKEDDLCLWIDPLDCTSGFTNNRLELVTILVGVSWKGRPILGFIGHPFNEEGGLSVYRPTITMGSPLLESSCCYEYFLDSDEWKVIHPCQNQTPNTTLVSCRNIGERQHRIMEKLQLSPMRASGAGYKCLQVIFNRATSVLLFESVTSKWDTCGAEAIILGMGGYVIKPNLELIDYSSHSKTSNPDGFLMTTDADLLFRFKQLLSEETVKTH